MGDALKPTGECLMCHAPLYTWRGMFCSLWCQRAFNLQGREVPREW
jgi:hypothetical protein